MNDCFAGILTGDRKKTYPEAHNAMHKHIVRSEVGRPTSTWPFYPANSLVVNIFQIKEQRLLGGALGIPLHVGLGIEKTLK